MVKECVICQKENSAYKCPACKSHYCSLICCKTHKETCIPVAKVTTIPIVTEELKPIVGFKGDNEKQFPTLTEQQKINIFKSPELLSLIKSKRLRADLQCIDTSKDRQEALGKMRRSNPEFEGFVNSLMVEINKQVPPSTNLITAANSSSNV